MKVSVHVPEIWIDAEVKHDPSFSEAYPQAVFIAGQYYASFKTRTQAEISMSLELHKRFERIVRLRVTEQIDDLLDDTE